MKFTYKYKKKLLHCLSPRHIEAKRFKNDALQQLKSNQHKHRKMSKMVA